MTASWLGRTSERLQTLADRPALVFLVLFAANALARPYAGFAHDARLYSVQVLNQVEPGSYADDLFLKYGSQDQFSIFSRLTAPLVACFGLTATFFSIYLIFNALFIFALQRLVLALVSDRALALLGLLYAMIAPLPFGGLGTFLVHEPFLTPRIMANALVLFGLERLLARRYWLSFALMLAAALAHPLMAQGGLLIFLLVSAWDWLPRWAFRGLIGLAIVAAATIILLRPIGLALFGEMDESWREIVRLASGYNFPTEWSARDWFNVFLSIGVVGAFAWTLRDEDRAKARFLGVTAVIGVAGFIGTLLGSTLCYAFLFQAQPYRVLWILKAVQAPLGFCLIVRLWKHETGMSRVAAIALALWFWTTGDQWLEFAFPLFFFPIAALVFRGLEPAPRHADWLSRSAVYSLVGGCVGWGLYKALLIVRGAEQLAPLIDGVDFVRLIIDHAGVMLWLTIALALAGFLALARPSPARAGVVLGIALAVQTAFFVAPNLPAYRQATRYEGDLREVAEFLNQERRAAKTRPTIYCSLGRIDYVWIDLKAKSYYDLAQIVGCLFNRGNAEEGRRRALVVRAFEISRIQETLQFTPEERLPDLEAMFQADVKTMTPSARDLARLCLEENVDYVILKQKFDDMAPVSFGSVHVYDARSVRRTVARTPDAASFSRLKTADE